MKQHSFLGYLVALWPLVVAAQSLPGEGKVFRLGELAPSSVSLEYTRRGTLPVLAEQGFAEGRNLVLDERAGDAAEMSRYAREILASNPDAILAIGGDAIRAATEATSTVPVVIFGAPPGGVTGYARRNGNVTGVVILGADLDAKRLDILREAVPSTAKRFAALMLASAPLRQASEREMKAVAANAGIDLLIFEANGPEDYSKAFAAMREARVQALVVMAHARFNRDGALIARFALESKLPTICEWADMTKVGCLLGYGPIREELRRRVAHQIAHLFKGTSAGDLPIELPTRYEFAVNLKIAKGLGLSLPQSILVRADEVIE